MSRENHYPTENKYDRKKNSKFEVGDLVKIQTGFPGSSKKEIRWNQPRNFTIVDKRQLHDKEGKYWVYDIFYPDDNSMQTDIKLINKSSPIIYVFTKLA